MKICPQCGNQCIDQAVQCPKCKVNLSQIPQAQQPQYQQVQQPYQQPIPVQNRSSLSCPRCHSQNVTVQAVAETKKRGCLSILLYILLAITIIGLIILIPLLRGNKSKTVSYAVCQNCGHRWRV